MPSSLRASHDLPTPTFNYASLDQGTRVLVEDARDRIKYLERRTSEGLIEIGRHLLAVKAEMPHGQFTPWLEAEFGWSEWTAQKMMAVARTFGETREIHAFQPSALYALASGTVPDEVRDDFIARADAGERVTHRDVKERLAVVNRETGEVIGEIDVESVDPADVPLPPRAQPHALTWMPPMQPSRADAEQAISDRIFEAVGDEDGNIARARLRASFSDARHATRDKLLALKPDAVAAIIEPDDLTTIDLFIADCRHWLDDLEATIGSGLRIVARKDA